MCPWCLAVAAVPAQVAPLLAPPADMRSSVLLGPAEAARAAVALVAAGLGTDVGVWQAERARALARPETAVAGLIRLASAGLVLASRAQQPDAALGLLQRLAVAAELDLAEQLPGVE